MDPNIGKHFFFSQEISTDLRIGQKVRWKKGGFFCEPLDEFRRKERVEEVLYKFRKRQWQPTPVLLPGKSHGGRSLIGCSPWGC